jgi:type I restriction enzyme S subunit
MIAKLKPYPKMKDSGLQWLGQVPGHWDVRPAFGAFVPNHERNYGMKEKTVLSLSYGRIVIKPAEKLHGLVPESFETYQIVNPGDIILRTTDLQNDHTSLRVGMVRNRGIITSAYLALRTMRGVDANFGFQFLNVWDASKAIYGYGSGLRQNLDFSHFKRMPVSVPPPSEQAAIVRFLDWSNGRLERAIRAKRKVIALLGEQKQAIIHRAVTRGLDPSVPLKPSGIPWLGEIPEHWKVARLRPLIRCLDGARIPLNAVQRGARQGPYPYWGATRIIDQIDAYLFDEPLVLLGEDGAPFFEKGRDVAYYVEGKLWVNNHAHVLRCGPVVQPRYLVHALNCVDYAAYIEGSTRDKLTQEKMGAIPIPLPPRNEQSSIVDQLGSLTAIPQTAISRHEREIELLREYRNRLTTDVVTGKLDVREAATRLPKDMDKSDTLEEGEVGNDEEEASL